MWLATMNPIILWISLDRHSLHITPQTSLYSSSSTNAFLLISPTQLYSSSSGMWNAVLCFAKFLWIFLSFGTFGVVISSNFLNSILGYCWIWKSYRKTWGWGLRIFATGPCTHVSQQESKDILLEQDGVRNIHPRQFREIAKLWWEGTP
jgi:hypothetical protein